MSDSSTSVARREAARQRDSGQFGVQARTRPGDAFGDAADPLSEDLAVIDFDDPVVGRRLLQESRRAVLAQARGAADIEDLQMEVIAAVYARAAKARSNPAVQGEHTPVPVGTSARVVIHRIAKDVMARAVSGISRSEDFRAVRALRDWVARQEQDGLEPTRAQVAEQAQVIAASFPARRRPTHGFERFLYPVRTVSLDADSPDGSRGEGMADRLVHEAGSRAVGPVSPDDFEPGSAGDRAMILADAGQAGNARLLAYTGLAERVGAPRVAESSMSEDSAASTRRVVAGRSPGALMSAWADEDGSVDEPTAAALFSPFGNNLTSQQRRDVAGVFASSGAYADLLWDAAVSAATKRRQRDRSAVA